MLLREPERVRHIVATLRDRLPSHITLTAKMRLGFENKELALENAQAIEQGGASLLTVHARTKVEGYQPPAHWDWVNKIRQAVQIPVVANGDVFTLSDYRAIREQSGCQDVMIGRGAVIRPDLARQIKQYLHRQTVQAACFHGEIMDWIRLFFTLCLEKRTARQICHSTAQTMARHDARCVSRSRNAVPSHSHPTRSSGYSKNFAEFCGGLNDNEMK